MTTGPAILSTDVNGARQMGFEVARAFQNRSPTARDQLYHWTGFFEGYALSTFADELGRELSPLRTESESASTWPDPMAAVAVSHYAWIIPTMAPKVVKGGFTVSFAATIFEESSHTVGVEVYTEKTAGASVSLEIPIKNVVKFKFEAGIKKGIKTSERDEERTARRTGHSVSRSFVVQRLSQPAIFILAKKTYHGVTKPTPQPMGLGSSQMAKRVTYDSPQVNPDYVFPAFQIEPKEGGDMMGPYWGEFKDPFVTQDDIIRSAITKIAEDLEKEKHILAKDLAYGMI